MVDKNKTQSKEVREAKLKEKYKEIMENPNLTPGQKAIATYQPPKIEKPEDYIASTGFDEVQFMGTIKEVHKKAAFALRYNYDEDYKNHVKHLRDLLKIAKEKLPDSFAKIKVKYLFPVLKKEKKDDKS